MNKVACSLVIHVFLVSFDDETNWHNYHFRRNLLFVYFLLSDAIPSPSTFTWAWLIGVRFIHAVNYADAPCLTWLRWVAGCSSALFHALTYLITHCQTLGAAVKWSHSGTSYLAYPNCMPLCFNEFTTFCFGDFSGNRINTCTYVRLASQTLSAKRLAGEPPPQRNDCNKPSFMCFMYALCTTDASQQLC